ncbi:SCO family protein [Terrihabitans sp. B22-R8]|uniref:SCO family protein n=1 Tax=Terrihabitans sp. B22-R8 TaxID=3425128 RepID=UPI00403D554E
MLRIPKPVRLRLLLASLLVLVPLASWAQPAGPDVGGAFSLTDHRGQRISDADLKGRPYALFFGFTHCPDVCPTALFELSLILKELGDEANDLRILFVSVDPERDTEQVLANYVAAFDPRITGLRGTPEETAAIARAFKAVYRRVPLDSESYTMDHTALVYLMDRRGQFFDSVDYRADQATQIARFRRLIASP